MRRFLVTISLCLFSMPLALADDGRVVITATEIREMQAHTMADILNTIAGISAGDSSVSIHGNYKVKVFVDGRPLNDPTSSYGGVKWDSGRPGRGGAYRNFTRQGWRSLRPAGCPAAAGTT